MKRRIKDWINKQRFTPSPMGILVNRDFIIRRSLWNAVRRHSSLFTGRVMDFGCGEKPYLSAFSAATEYIGVEIELSGHDPQKKKADVFYDGVTLPFAEASFDGVVSFEVFQSVPNPEHMLGEIGRVLKPGGLMLMTYPFAWEEVEMPYDLARYTSAGLLAHLSAADMEVIDIAKTPNYLSTLTQLLSLWLSHAILPWRNPIQRLLSTAFVIAPLNALGLLLGHLLPNDERLFHNVVILARKRQPVG